MILEKLKEHGVKIMFLIMNISVVATGVMLIKQKSTEKELEKVTTAAAEAEIAPTSQSYKSAADYAYDAQQRVKADKEAKLNSIANNTGTVSKQQSVPVTKTIPAVTKTVTTTAPTSSTTASYTAPKAAAPAKATTKKS
ncbi:MAG: hypothetical protein WCI36_01620 [bacterium]